MEISGGRSFPGDQPLLPSLDDECSHDQNHKQCIKETDERVSEVSAQQHTVNSPKKEGRVEKHVKDPPVTSEFQSQDRCKDRQINEEECRAAGIGENLAPRAYDRDEDR